jgi:hypothetical protein
MPRTHPPDALSRWLAAEQSGFAEDAEAALLELLEELPRPAPPAGFADRVLARTVITPLAASTAHEWGKRRPLAGLRLRAWRLGGGRVAVSAAALAAVLLGLLWLPAVVRAVLGAASISALLQAGISSIVALGQGVAGVLVLGNKLVLLGRALAEPLATPPVAALALGCLLVSVVALRCLYDLIQRDRRWVNVDPI